MRKETFIKLNNINGNTLSLLNIIIDDDVFPYYYEFYFERGDIYRSLIKYRNDNIQSIISSRDIGLLDNQYIGKDRMEDLFLQLINNQKYLLIMSSINKGNISLSDLYDRFRINPYIDILRHVL